MYMSDKLVWTVGSWRAWTLCKGSGQHSAPPVLPLTMGVQADKASEPFVFEKLEIQILHKFSVSLFVMPVRNSIFFSFFFFKLCYPG